MLSEIPKDLYVSKRYWEFFLQSSFIPSYVNPQSAIVGMPGSGIMALLKYTSRNTAFFEQKLLKQDKNRIIIFLSLDSFSDQEETTRSQLLESLETFINSHKEQFVGTNLYKRVSKFQTCVQILTYLTNELEYKITLVLSELEHFEKVASKVSQLRNIRSDRINTIYVFYHEVSIESISKGFGYISHFNYFSLFDSESVKQYILQTSQKEGHALDESLYRAIYKYSGGDGTLVKVITYKALADISFRQVLETDRVKDIWSALGEQFLIKRFQDITMSLSNESLTWLKTREGAIPIYLQKIGIISQEGNMYSPLFDYFIKNHPDSFIGKNVKEKSTNFDTAVLTGKEYEIYNFLNNNPRIINKTELAHTLWSTQAGESYSLWTLDKLLSNVRKKLKKYNSDRRLVVIRHKGIQLV